MVDLGLNSAVFLGQVNTAINSAGILGIGLVVAGAGLYFLRSVRPTLSRDQDIVFAAISLLCGLILIFQGWRLDPILQFGQFLLTGVAVAFGVETIRLRSATTEQARRNTPIVDDDRPTSRVYRAELDDEEEELEPPEADDPEPIDRRLRGTREPREPRSSAARRQHEAPESRSPRPRREANRRPTSSERSPKASSRASSPAGGKRDREAFEREPRTAAPDERERPRRSERLSRSQSPAARPTPRPTGRGTASTSSKRAARPASPSRRSAREDYVDYRPVDSSDGDDSRDSGLDLGPSEY
ncbi:MAG: hypothetical protein BRC58_01620 [Cyanobacteria bacterium QS_8_64_29]|nr:MAG: hypothetical protein BRC58_01620 [Cyanobacteria bacterium QS_8_64_29]